MRHALKVVVVCASVALLCAGVLASYALYADNPLDTVGRNEV